MVKKTNKSKKLRFRRGSVSEFFLKNGEFLENDHIWVLILSMTFPGLGNIAIGYLSNGFMQFLFGCLFLYLLVLADGTIGLIAFLLFIGLYLWSFMSCFLRPKKVIS